MLPHQLPALISEQDIAHLTDELVSSSHSMHYAAHAEEAVGSDVCILGFGQLTINTYMVAASSMLTSHAAECDSGCVTVSVGTLCRRCVAHNTTNGYAQPCYACIQVTSDMTLEVFFHGSCCCALDCSMGWIQQPGPTASREWLFMLCWCSAIRAHEPPSCCCCCCCW